MHPYRVVGLVPGHYVAALKLASDENGPLASVLRDEDEVTLMLSDATWSQAATGFPDALVSGPLCAIALEVGGSLEAVGYLAAGVSRLAEAGVSVFVQCAYTDAVILVPWDQAHAARGALEALIEESS